MFVQSLVPEFPDEFEPWFVPFPRAFVWSSPLPSRSCRAFALDEKIPLGFAGWMENRSSPNPPKSELFPCPSCSMCSSDDSGSSPPACAPIRSCAPGP